MNFIVKTKNDPYEEIRQVRIILGDMVERHRLGAFDHMDVVDRLNSIHSLMLAHMTRWAKEPEPLFALKLRRTLYNIILSIPAKMRQLEWHAWLPVPKHAGYYPEWHTFTEHHVIPLPSEEINEEINEVNEEIPKTMEELFREWGYNETYEEYFEH